MWKPFMNTNTFHVHKHTHTYMPISPLGRCHAIVQRASCMNYERFQVKGKAAPTTGSGTDAGLPVGNTNALTSQLFVASECSAMMM